MTDAEVCESFLSSVAPGGFMRGLLDAGQLACIIGSPHAAPSVGASSRIGSSLVLLMSRIGSTLFLHGGFQSRGGCALGRVPGRDGEVKSPPQSRCNLPCNFSCNLPC